MILPTGERLDISELDEQKISELYTSNHQDVTRSSNEYELIVPHGGEYKLTLPDGSDVWVNSNSKLRFKDFDLLPERQVELEGEAYFEVAKNKAKPFIVKTPDAQTRVLGTHFNINTYNGRTKTTLLEGSISFANKKENLLLKPGHYVENLNNTLKTGIADVARDLSWRNNEFYFKEDNIKYITDQLQRWYDIQVEFGQGISMKTGYTGRIKRTATLQEVVEMLNYVVDLKLEIKNKVLLVKEK